MSKRLFVFMDASNMWAVQKTKGKMFDLAELKKYLKNQYQASQIKIYYYDAYPEQSTRDHDISGKFRFHLYLEKALGFVIRKKALKQIRITTPDGIVIQEKGNMDVELTMDFVNQVDNYDQAILFSGDSDFLALIRFARSKGKKVFVYSSKNNISKELLTGSDGYADILNIDAKIWRGEVKHRAS